MDPTKRLPESESRISTGVKGLNEILNGGLISQNSYLIRGGPGTGKSTFGYKFLEAGQQAGEKGLLISLGESEESIIRNTGILGIDLSDIKILDMSPQGQLGEETSDYTVFHTADVEREPIVDKIVMAME